MKKIMFLGQAGSGKEELIQRLANLTTIPPKAMAVSYFGSCINTPSEFLENRKFHFALITTSSECGTIVFVQNATHTSSLFPPQFATMFNKPVIGVIAQSTSPPSSPTTAELFLKNAGVKKSICVHIDTPNGLIELTKCLM